MTATETSAVTWGETRVSYSIRRSARRRRPGRGSGTPHQEPARRDCESEGRLDRAADQTRGGQRLAAVTSRVRQRRERAVSRATLSPEGSSARNRRRQAARRVAPHARTGGSEANGPHPIRTRLVFRHRAAERLPERVAAWQSKAGVTMPRVVIADQQKRWGSCNRNGIIRLNWRIIQAPMRLVDYVIVHELVHLRHDGHGRDYWQAVGRVMPDYERRREDLRQRGVDLAW